MMNSNPKLCRLCLKPCGDDFETIDECTKQILYKLLIKLNFSLTVSLRMCKNCSENLQNAFDFKSFCLSMENYIASSSQDSEGAEVNLKNVYQRKNGYANAMHVPGDQSVCRFCLTLIKNESFICLNGEEKKVVLMKVGLQKYFPELDINIIDEPVACLSCHQSLTTYFEFAEGLSVAQEKIKHNLDAQGTDTKGSVKLDNSLEYKADYGDTKLSKIEEIFYDNTNSDIMLDEMLTESENQNLCIKNEEVDIKTDQSDSIYDLTQDSSDGKATPFLGTYKCEMCLYETQYKHSLRRHMLTHMTCSEAEMYKCELCPYQSKYKANLKLHLIIHEDQSTITKYTCEVCGYKTKYKHHLTHHMITHKGRTEVTMFKCALCTYETKNKYHLKQHMMVHSNTTIYKCEFCSYEAKHQRCFKRHMLTHKTYSEVTMYKCEECAFETKHKGCLKRHAIMHIDASKIAMYECDKCAFKTKTKSNLKLHMLRHSRRGKRQLEEKRK